MGSLDKVAVIFQSEIAAFIVNRQFQAAAVIFERWSEDRVGRVLDLDEPLKLTVIVFQESYNFV